MVWISEQETPAQKDYVFEEHFDMTERDKLLLKHEDLKRFEETVPAKKTWSVYVRIEINERDA